MRRFLDVRLQASSDGMRVGGGCLIDFPGLQFGCLWSSSFKKIFFNIYSLLKVRDRAQVGEGQRVGDTESEAGSKLSAQSPTWGSN